MFAYALLGAATVVAIYLLWLKRRPIEASEMELADNLVYVGLAFIPSGCSWGLFGQKRLGGITGRGILKKPGLLPRGLPTLPTCTIGYRDPPIGVTLC